MRQNLLTILALLVTFAVPAIAGGPVLIEDATETATPAPGLTPGEKVGLAILGLIIIGAIAGSGGSDSGAVCNGDPTPPQPGC